MPVVVSRKSLIPLALVLTVAVISVMLYSFEMEHNSAEHTTPLVDASVKIGFETALAHLWFKEAISGDNTVTLRLVWNHLTSAENYAKAMLSGDEIEGNVIPPIVDDSLRERINKTLEALNEFRSIAKLRWSEIHTSGIGSSMDQRFDVAFIVVIGSVKQLEIDLKNKIKKQQKHIHIVQKLLLGIVGLLGLIVSFAFAQFIRGKESDIQSLQERQEKLNTIEQRYRALFERSNDAIFLVHRRSGEYLDANDAALRLTGRTYSELIGALASEVCPEGVEQRMKKAAHQRGASDYGLVDYLHPDKSVRTARLSVVGLDENSVIGIARDVTEDFEIERQLRRAQKMDAVGQLTGGIAHDFNNILGAILGNNDLLELEIDDKSKALHRIARIRESTKRAAQLVAQLLSFTRKTSHKKSIVNVNDILMEMDALLDGSVAPKILVEQGLGDDLWLTEIDREELKDAMLNIFLNSRDAMPNGGVISITTKNTNYDAADCSKDTEVRQGDFVSIIIRDTGVGIPKDQLEHIFEPYFSTKKGEKGTGLGLSMVFGFAKRSSGFIKVTSQLGTGTEFQISLPKAVGHVKPAIPEKVPSPKESAGNEQILLVDDEKQLLFVTKDSLEKLGYQVLTAENALEALQRLSENPSIRIMISDIVMPGEEDGYDLARTVKNKYPQLEVLLTTGFAGKSKNFDSHNVDDCINIINKPYSQKELAIEIRRELDKAEA